MTRDAGEPPTWPVAGSGDNATAVGLYSAIVTALYRRERTGKGSYVTTSLLAEGVWSASVSIQAALCEAKFFGPHDRKNPANAALNVYRASDGTWFVLIVTPDKLAAVAKAIGRADLLTDPRFADPAKLIQNMPQLDRHSGRSLRLAADDPLVRSLQRRSCHVRRRARAAGSRQRSAAARERHHRSARRSRRQAERRRSAVPFRCMASQSACEACSGHSANTIEQVLEQLGFSATEIDGLHSSGAIPNTKAGPT